MSHRRLVYFSLVVTALIVSATVAPAFADSATNQDRRGDAPTYLDMTRIKVTNGGDVVSATVAIVNLRPRKATFQLAIDPARTSDVIYFAVTTPRQHRPGYRNQLVRINYRPSEPQSTTIPCKQMKSRWRNGSASDVKITLPQRCLGRDSGTARFWGATTPTGPAYDYDETRHFRVRQG